MLFRALHMRLLSLTTLRTYGDAKVMGVKLICLKKHSYSSSSHSSRPEYGFVYAAKQTEKILPEYLSINPSQL
jgi:hypothetical protein